MVGELLSDWGGLGAGGLVTVIVILVLTGRLVPAREMRYWRDAFFEEQRQKQALISATQVTQDVLKALPESMPHRQEGPPS